MTKRIYHLIEELKRLYPEAGCTLAYKKDYELLFATRLAAQCTDARVNIVCKGLYTKYPSLSSLADADIAELEQEIRPCGFYHTKALDIKRSAEIILTDFNGVVPDSMDNLLKLPGIGRKTANLMMGELYGQPAIVTDTHCIRLSGRLGLTDSTDPVKVEQRLAEIIEPSEQLGFCHRLVCHGRAVCTARSPKCRDCTLDCPSSKA